jgi:hypothetical protein
MIREKRVPFLVPQAGESTGYIRVSSGLGQNADGVVYKNEVEFRYGIYDIGRNTGFVNVGTDHDTGAFAVASIRGWWRHEGKRLYPKAKSLLMTADAGAAMAGACAYGRSSCRNSPMNPV